MTAEEREVLENAWAQATGAQNVLLALIIRMLQSGQSREFLESVFDLAAEPSVQLSLGKDAAIATQATRTLQVIDHMRSSALGKSIPK